MFNTPVLLVVYNRPDYTLKLLEAIKRVQPKNIYIAADGPKNDTDKELTDKTRNVFSLIDWDCDVKTLYREHNAGCGPGVSSAINWFFEQVEYGIILEDDCIPAISFFHFCEKLLLRYKDNESIMMIGGSSWFDNEFEYSFDYFFTNIGSIWGWATWKRAWIKYTFTITEDMIESVNKNRVWKEISNKKIRKFRKELFQTTYDKRVDTWDIQWIYCLSVNRGISILPIKNQITNIGINGVNYKSESALTNLLTYPIDVNHLRHPEIIGVDKALDIFYQNLEAHKFLTDEPILKYYYNKTKYYILQILILLGFRK